MKLFLFVLFISCNLSFNSFYNPFCNTNARHWLKHFYGNPHINYLGTEKLILNNGIKCKPIEKNEGISNKDGNMKLLLDLSYTHEKINNEFKLEFYGPDSFVYLYKKATPKNIFQIFQRGPDSIVTDVFWIDSNSFIICTISENSGSLSCYDLKNMEIKTWILPKKMTNIWGKFKSYLKVKENMELNGVASPVTRPKN